MFDLSIIFALIRKYKEFSILKMKLIYGTMIVFNLFIVFLYNQWNSFVLSWFELLKVNSWAILKIGLILMIGLYIFTSFLSLKKYFKTFNYKKLKEYQEKLDFDTNPWMITYTLIILFNIWISIFLWAFWIISKLMLFQLNDYNLLSLIFAINFIFLIIIFFLLLLLNELMTLIQNDCFEDELE